jgi:gliding motility-associated-like protein
LYLEGAKFIAGMTQALNHISGSVKFKMLIVFLTLCAIAGNTGAQVLPSPPYPFRLANYREDLIWGNAAPGATVKVYYAEFGSFSPKTLLPFASVVADDRGYWIYSNTYAGLGEFEGPVVVSMTLAEGGPEIFESPILGPNEVFIFDRRPCADTQTLIMVPGVNEVYNWRSRSGTRTTQYAVLENAPPGTYTMDYTNRGGRTYKSGSVTFDGPPRVFSAEIQLRCGESSVSYSGVYSGSADSFYWEAEDGTTAGRTWTLDLSPGKYKFYATSPGGCTSGPAIVNVLAAPSLATADLSSKKIRKADCNQSNGSITDIKVIASNNRTLNYRWKDTRGNVYYAIDLYGLLPDKYTLEAYTSDGACSTFLTEEEILENNAITFTSDEQSVYPASCGVDNGSITKLSSNATIFNWYKGADRITPVWQELEFKNATPGVYALVLGNEFGCSLEKTFEIGERSPAISLITLPLIKDDHCGLGGGSITGAEFNTSVTCTWLNEAGEKISTSRNLSDVSAGTYTLLVKSNGCEKSFTYTINNAESIITAPVMDDIVVCGASEVNFSFKEHADIYRVYDSGGKLLSQGSSKNFKLNLAQPGSYYAALASGSCESPRTIFNLSFGEAGLKIPSSFSPNGDGINDKWIIGGLEVYTAPEVQLFNRQGVVVYHSRSQSQPFDGKNNGIELPVGVYYYIINTGSGCPAASGSLTLIR